MSSTLDSTVNAPIANRETRMDHLDWLEAESIHILREIVAECSKPALLFSGGTGPSSFACARKVGGVFAVTCFSLENNSTSFASVSCKFLL